jgi:hypothetical protein
MTGEQPPLEASPEFLQIGLAVTYPPCSPTAGEVTGNATFQAVASGRRPTRETAQSTGGEKGHLFENAKIKAAAF